MIKLNDDYLTVTPRLKDHWLKAIGSDHEGLKVSFEKGGCSGEQLTFELLEVGHGKDDSYIALNDTAKLYLDQKVMHVFAGATLDLVDEGINQVVKLDGPNLGNSCGCGQSYGI